jgi:cell division transport system permease protein
MGLRVWKYYFKRAITDIFSHRLIHFISMGTISISLLFFGSFLLLFLNVSQWIQEMGHSLTLSVYLEEGISEEQKKRIETFLKRQPDGEITDFISKEKAMSDLLDAMGHQSGILDGLEENPLPASFEMLFRDPAGNRLDPERIKASLEELDGVEDVQYSQQWLERLQGLMHVMKLVGFTLGGILCLGVLFIITNTIKLTIYSRSEEIEILKIVGATDWFVKTPFLIEGALQGFVGGLVALWILLSVYSVFSLRHLRVFGLPVLKSIFLPTEYTVFVLSTGFLLGLVGSFIALGRFFKL